MFDFIRDHQLNIMLTLCAACMTMAMLLLITKFLTKRRKWILILMEVLASALLMFDRMAYVYSGIPDSTAYIMVRISNFMVFFLTSAIVFGFDLYLIDLLTVDGGMDLVPRRITFVGVISVIGMILAIVAAFTGLYYHFDENNVYHSQYGISVHLFHPPLTNTKSASGLMIPKEFKADPREGKRT